MLLSLAYQLACRLPGYRKQLDEMLTSKGLSREILLKDLNIVALFDELLKGPLSKLESPNNGRSYVILVDALDECEESGRMTFFFVCSDILKNFQAGSTYL